MKGIILAGGSGTRLYPITEVVSKQLLPIYDKPMIYYSISVLLLADIRDILIISTPQDLPLYEKILGDGSELGINIEYLIQPKPEGLAQAFIIGDEFIGDDNVALILGDNIFYGNGLTDKLFYAIDQTKTGKATVIGYRVSDPQRFGVLELDDDNKVLSIVEKPEVPKSNIAATGLYFYPNSVIRLAKNLKPSSRGELEITDLNNLYLKDNQLESVILGRGFTWLDTGTVDSLIEASEFVKTIQKQQGIMISSIHEIAYKKGWISTIDFNSLKEKYNKSLYGEFLSKVN